MGCAGFVTNDRGELLVVKEAERHNDVRLQWKLPGGMLDRGEDIEAAAKREVRKTVAAAAPATNELARRDTKTREVRAQHRE